MNNITTDLSVKRFKFLTDTINHYTIDNRASLNGKCMYSPIEGVSIGCALGRHIPDKELCNRLDKLRKSVMSNDVFESLPLEIQELGRTFLFDIQCLHDTISNWDENGLTVRGESRVKLIQINFIQ